MKKIIILIAAAFIYTGAYAQNSKIRYLVDTYSGEEDVVSLYIPGFLCKLAANIGDCSYEEEKLLRSIQSVRVLVCENSGLNKQVNFVEELETDRWGPDYHLMLSVSKNDEEVRIFSHEKSGRIRELIIVVSGDDENVLVRVKGRMQTDLLHALGGVIDVEAAEFTKEL